MIASIDDPLVHLPTLAAIATSGSFSRAADALGLNRAAVSKRVARMESALGVPVLSRTTRRVELTLAGQALLARHREAEAVLQLGVDEARGAMSAIGGHVRVVCASSSLAVHLVGPALFEFAHVHPGIRIDLTALIVDAASSLPDIELRITDTPPTDRSARTLAKVSWAFYASAAYVKRHGQPVSPADLMQHRFVVPASHDHPATFEHGKTRQSVTAQPDHAMTSNIQEVVYELVKRGAAIGLLPNYLRAAAEGEGELLEVLSDWRLVRLPAQTLYAIHPAAKYQRAATRAVLDYLVQICAELPGQVDEHRATSVGRAGSNTQPRRVIK
jgi:DNA-binding transcriptional LysR family regulator